MSDNPIANLIDSLLEDASPGSKTLEQWLEDPKDRSHGDIAFPCFRLSKPLKKAPPQIAKELESKLVQLIDQHKDLEKVEAAGPYLNFFYTPTKNAEIIEKILSRDFLHQQQPKGEKVMIEYSQPNTHKAFHVGHMRNVALGDALIRLYEHQGFEVIAANYIGDVGAHIAKCLWVYRDHPHDGPPEHYRGEYLGSLYAKADELLDFKLLTEYPLPRWIAAQVQNIQSHSENPKWKIVDLNTGQEELQVICGGQGFNIGDIVPYAPVGAKMGGRLIEAKEMGGILSKGFIASRKELGSGPEKADIHLFPKDTPIGIELTELGRIDKNLGKNIQVADEMERRQKAVSDILKGLESKDPELTQLWTETRQWSIDEFKEIYEWLGARFDHDFYESEVGDEGKKIVKDAYDKDILIKSEGAIGADLSKEKLGFFMLLKSDGTGLYSTKDLALAQKKFDQFKIDRSIYVVDMSQSLHFKQVFKTLEKLGWSQAEKCYHLAYGLVMLPPTKENSGAEKMGSRKGNVITFSKLRNGVGDKIHQNFLSSFESEWPKAEIDEANRIISAATIRFGMLDQDPIKEIIFDMENWTSRTGRNGPYMLYAYARIRSIIRKAGGIPEGDWDPSLLSHPSERIVLLELARFKRIAERAALDYAPQLMCAYLFELAKSYSKMTEQCHVLKAESEALKHSRLKLIDATSQVLKKGMELIGIQCLERM